MQPSRRISVSQSSVRRKRDSILLDSNYSRSNLKAMLFSIKERESGGITTIAPDIAEDKVRHAYRCTYLICTHDLVLLPFYSLSDFSQLWVGRGLMM